MERQSKSNLVSALFWGVHVLAWGVPSIALANAYSATNDRGYLAMSICTGLVAVGSLVAAGISLVPNRKNYQQQ